MFISSEEEEEEAEAENETDMSMEVHVNPEVRLKGFLCFWPSSISSEH